jgi:ATP phosphoribosyltransferase
VITFIGVAKGELGAFFQAYLRSLGAGIDINGPLTQYNRLPGGGVKFRIQRSRDVPRCVGNDGLGGYDFGMTGNDVAWDEIYAGNENIGMGAGLQEEAKALGYAGLLGKLAVLGREGTGSKKDKLKVAVSDYYPNIAKRELRKLMGLGPEDYELDIYQGSVEGYISGDNYDLAIDTIFSSETITNENEELARQGKAPINVVRNIMDTYPMIIYDNRGYGLRSFGELFNSGKETNKW